MGLFENTGVRTIKRGTRDEPRTQRHVTGHAYVLLAMTMFMWGGNAVASRLAVGEISPMALTCLRLLIAVGGILAITHKHVIREWRVLRPHWRFALIMGACGYTGFSAFMYAAATYTTAVNLSILQGSIPVIVLLGALALYGTPIRAIQLVGVAVTLLGVAFVATKGALGSLAAFDLNFGDALMLCACVLYAGYTLALRRRPKISGMTFYFGMAAGGFVASLPLLAYEIISGTVHWPTAQGLGVLLYVALGPSLAAQILYMRGVELIGPGRAGLFVNLVPIFGAFLAVLILGETFALYHAVALALVLGGIFLAERSGRSAAKDRAG